MIGQVRQFVDKPPEQVWQAISQLEQTRVVMFPYSFELQESTQSPRLEELIQVFEGHEETQFVPYCSVAHAMQSEFNGPVHQLQLGSQD